MAIWSAELATRSSAKRACKWGGIFCLLQAARMTLANIVSVTAAGKYLDDAIAWLVGASLIPALFVVAGWRLWRSDDWTWASLAALVMLVDFALYGPYSSSVGAVTMLVVRVALLVGIVNGVRGALALRRIDRDTGRVFS
jgi:hypothetical protein